LVTDTCANVQSVLDFGPVVKPLGITVKKEAGKVVETSDLEICSYVPSHKRVSKKGYKHPGAQTRGPKRFLNFQKF